MKKFYYIVFLVFVVLAEINAIVFFHENLIFIGALGCDGVAAMWGMFLLSVMYDILINGIDMVDYEPPQEYDNVPPQNNEKKENL